MDIGKKSEIQYYTQSTIAKRPYSAAIFLPPWERHKLSYFKLMYIEEGEVQIEFYGRNGGKSKFVNAKVGDAFIVSPSDTHRYIIKRNIKYCHKDIYVSPELMKECCDLLSEDLFDFIVSQNYATIFSLSHSTIVSFSEILTYLNSKQRSKERDSLHKSVVFAFLGQYLAVKNQKYIYPAWLKKLLSDIEQEKYFSLSIEELVKRTGCSHGYICRQFKKIMEVPLKKYVTRMRLSQSVVLLATTDFSLEEIAYKLNYTALSNYINSFKAEYGISPGKYRKEHLSKNELGDL